MSKRPPPSDSIPLNITTTGLRAVDLLSANADPSLQDYLDAVSEYVRNAAYLTPAASKTAQIALSTGLARVLRGELKAVLPRIDPHAGELTVAGALRTARADVSEAHPLDGLRLAVEIKPVNLAVGRALWNRFGDIRAFAVNIHLKFPFAVVGGVLAIPTWEWAKVGKTAAAAAAMATVPGVRAVDPTLEAEALAETRQDGDVDETDEVQAIATGAPTYKRSTQAILERLVKRLGRTRFRETEADAAHLLEAVTVIVYNPDTGELDQTLPPVGSGLRWDEFVRAIADAYDIRFED